MRIVVLVLFALAAQGGAVRADAPVHSDADYAAVLDAYVDGEGRVDYAALKSDRARLDAWVTSLGSLDRRAYEAWEPADKIAFWINAYNGLTLRLIVDHYPIESSLLKSLVYPKNSIRQIPGAWTEVSFEVMGESLTLDAIEHEILRPEFDEPRIHVALVCAAVSCPPLRNEPYRGDRLEGQLDDQARRFLSDAANLRVDREDGVVRLSAIFDWFGADFVPRYGTGDPPGRREEDTQAVLNFVARYTGDETSAYLHAGGYRVKYIDYDWTLNEQP